MSDSLASLPKRGMPGNAMEKAAAFNLLRQIATGIERLFASHCEVVIHDFSDLEHSIVHLQGSLSDRSIGGAATDLLLKRVQAGDTSEDLHGYTTQLPNGRILKSSTIFLNDENGEAYGAFCINYDMSAFLGIHKLLSEFIKSGTENVSEALSDDINQTIGAIITETINEMEITGPLLSRDDKITLIAKLDDKGVFRVKKAASILATQFGFSKATIYNYLREARSGALPRQSDGADGDKDANTQTYQK
jgi:predicted transcriptional regulator YheO